MNMRKIIAVLAAVLMLCSVVPMGALTVSAANGDVVVDYNFDDGSNGGFERSVNENGYIVFDATTADWQNTFAYLGLKSDTMYKVTFKAMANKDAILSFKIQNGWTSAHVAEAVEVTTEWQDYELVVNSGTVDGGAIVLFTSGYTAGNAPIYYIDDLKIVETVDPALLGKVINGDFSSEEGWKLGTGATIVDGALKLENIGGWSEAAMQTVPVKANTNYEITWKSQRVSGSGAFNMIVMNSALANMQVISGQNWMTDTSGNWIDHTLTVNTGDSEVMIFKLTTEVYGLNSTLLLDDINVTELKDPSFDGYITNGDFETGKLLPWDNLWGSSTVELVEGHNSDYAMKVQTGRWNHVRQTGIAVEPNTDYLVKFYAKDASNVSLLIKDSADTANIANYGFSAGSEWTAIAMTFNSGDHSAILISFMGPDAEGATGYYTVDDVTMCEKLAPSDDGYITNGNFEAGNLSGFVPTQGTAASLEAAYTGNYGAHLKGNGTWGGMLDGYFDLEAGKNYTFSFWYKANSAGSNWTLKQNDTLLTGCSGWINLTEWTKVEVTFDAIADGQAHLNFCGGNTGVAEDLYVDDIAIVCNTPDHVCEYELTGGTWPTCETPGSEIYTCECGESYTVEIPAYHNNNMEYNPAKDAIDCQNPGNIENWYCPGCYEYFADAYAENIINPWYITITADCVRPEDAADCATVPCVVCGEDIYGYGEHDLGENALCIGGTCSKCGENIEGYGHQNYDGPACLPGNCYYCGEAMEPVAHENGAWAPCKDGECAYGCGLTYPATDEHVDEDADDYCDTCWDHLAHIDEDADGWCDLCWNEMPAAEIIYGDANGDGVVDGMDEVLLSQYLSEWDVELDEVAADANGDGVVDGMDEVLLSQYLSEWDVVLGPQG